MSSTSKRWCNFTHHSRPSHLSHIPLLEQASNLFIVLSMTDIAFPLFPLLSLIGFVLSLIPLPWHLQVWNSGTCYFMIWSAISCLNKFVNSIVWAGSAADSAPALCEICASAAFSTIALLVTNWVHLNSPATRITIGASVGIPAASLCINRRLYMIARVQAVSVTRAEVGPPLFLAHSRD